MPEEELVTLIPLYDQLVGERIILRPYRENDAPALFEAVAESREHIRPWLPWADAHQRIEETRDYIIQQHAKRLLREVIDNAIFEKTSGRFLGGIGLHPHDWKIRSFEIGYWLRASATGHGYMTEAVRLLTDYAFDELGAQRVMIRCDERNAASAAVPKRLGYVLEGRLRNDSQAPDGSLRTTLVFALIPSDRS